MGTKFGLDVSHSPVIVDNIITQSDVFVSLFLRQVPNHNVISFNPHSEGVIDRPHQFFVEGVESAHVLIQYVLISHKTI